MYFIKNKLSKYFWLLLAFILLCSTLIFNIFIGLDQGEVPEQSDVIIVVEGSSDRAYKGVDLLLDGYSTSDKLIVSPATEQNLPHYFAAGSERDQLILEEEATSTWTNATNTIEMMEEHNWDSALVVTTDFHTRRTRLSFKKAAAKKDIDFTYVSSYQEVNGQPISYLDYESGRRSGVRETLKMIGYIFGLYNIIDM